MLDNPHHGIANHSHLLGVESDDLALEDRLPVSRNPTCKRETQIPIRKRAILAELFWQNLCGRWLSSSKFDQQLWESIRRALYSRVTR